MEGIVYICKGCGRAIRTKTPPKYCYFDRLDHLENISDEDAIKMGLFSFGIGMYIDDSLIEFPKDFKYSPSTGEAESKGFTEMFLKESETLSKYQDVLFAKVVG